ncbi:MAG: MCE family protein [Cryobacterium sp.]|nr:MCE family protein [Oligoflexia bacterium]
MNPTEASKATTVRVGLFSLLGLALVGAFTVFVNDRPSWWRGCDPVFITVEDATGLKTKSAIRSLGLQIGYLHSVELTETRVRIGVCITAPVSILPTTRAYIRGEGFLGDKFVELKPVQYTGKTQVGPRDAAGDGPSISVTPTSTSTSGANSSSLKEGKSYPVQSAWTKISNFLIPSAEASKVDEAREVPVGEKRADMDKLMDQSAKLMNEMTDLTRNLKEGLQPAELRETIQALNKTLQSASRTLSPEGGLNSTARRALEKLEKAFDAFQQQAERINRGEGSLGRILNDPVYADEMLKAMKNLNKLLNKAADIQFIVRLGADQLPAYDGGRGYFQLQVYPNPSRYYLIGITLDPRGSRSVLHTTTSSGTVSTTTTTEQIEEGKLLLTGMLGKVLYNRLDVAAGALHGDGAISTGVLLGSIGFEDMVILKNDVYVRGRGVGLNDRLSLRVRPFAHSDLLKSFYLSGGVESFRKVNGKTPFLFGAGVSFSDDDIKLLFAFK